MSPLSPSIINGIDSCVDVVVKKDKIVEKAVQQCKEQWEYLANFSASETHMLYSSLNLPIFEPPKIDLVLQSLLRIPCEKTCDIGIYISVLIQNSYDTGHNDFVLHTQNAPLDCLCAWIRGTESEPVKITVYGDTGISTGGRSEWCSVRQEGSAQDKYFQESKNDEIFISGTASFFPLIRAYDVAFKTNNQTTFDYVKKEIHERLNDLNFRPYNLHLALIDAKGALIDSFPEADARSKTDATDAISKNKRR